MSEHPTQTLTRMHHDERLQQQTANVAPNTAPAVTQLLIDPRWSGATYPIGGHMVHVLGLELEGKWHHIAMSPDSLDKLHRWCALVLAQGTPSETPPDAGHI